MSLPFTAFVRASIAIDHVFEAFRGCDSFELEQALKLLPCCPRTPPRSSVALEGPTTRLSHMREPIIQHKLSHMLATPFPLARRISAATSGQEASLEQTVEAP